MNEITLIFAGLTGLLSGILGSMLGIGGGIFIVPFLSFGIGVPMQIAASSSLITIIANSCTASISYLKANFTNVRLGILLVSATVPGAIIGSIIATYVSSSILSIIFAILVLYIAIYMLIRSRFINESMTPSKSTDMEPRFTSWRIGEYYEPVIKSNISYRIINLHAGLWLSLMAGCFSSLLGIGGGVIQVPVMNILMKVPFKIAVATSSLMISVTAATGAIIYIIKGLVMPSIVAPLVLGAYLGSIIGARLVKRIKGRQLQLVFAFILLLVSAIMFLRGFNII